MTHVPRYGECNFISSKKRPDCPLFLTDEPLDGGAEHRVADPVRVYVSSGRKPRAILLLHLGTGFETLEALGDRVFQGLNNNKARSAGFRLRGWLCQGAVWSRASVSCRRGDSHAGDVVYFPALVSLHPRRWATGGDITEGTVKTHVKNLLEKLDATSRTEALAVAARRGLITL